MSDGDGVVDIKDGVRDLVLEDVENAEYFPPVITREMRVRLTPPLVFSPELRETFSRHWFEKGMEGGSPPSLAVFVRNGLGAIFDIAQDCFNRGSTFQASNSASGHVASSTRATTD